MKFTLRPIEKKDEAAVAVIIRTVMSSYGCEGEGYSIEDPEVDHMFDAYQIDGAAFYVIEDESGTLQGCGGLGPLEGADNICELKKMYFYSPLRGQGFGKKLVSLCIDKAKMLGYQEMYLETLDRMKRANILYTKMGFKPLEAPKGCTGHSKCDAFYSLKLNTA